MGQKMMDKIMLQFQFQYNYVKLIFLHLFTVTEGARKPPKNPSWAFAVDLRSDSAWVPVWCGVPGRRDVVGNPPSNQWICGDLAYFPLTNHHLGMIWLIFLQVTSVNPRLEILK